MFKLYGMSSAYEFTSIETQSSTIEFMNINEWISLADKLQEQKFVQAWIFLILISFTIIFTWKPLSVELPSKNIQMFHISSKHSLPVSWSSIKWHQPPVYDEFPGRTWNRHRCIGLISPHSCWVFETQLGICHSLKSTPFDTNQDSSPNALISTLL